MGSAATARSTRGTVLAAGAAFAIAAAAVYFHRLHFKSDSLKPPLKRRQKDCDLDPQLLQRFQVAAEESRALNQMSNTEKLILYSLYKQSRVGDAPDTSPRFSINIVERAKHTAWVRLRGMSATQAMIHYIEAVQIFQANGIVDKEGVNDEVFDDLDVLDNLPIWGGFGMQPSSLANAVQDDGDGDQGKELTTAQKLLHAAGQDNVEEIKAILAENPTLIDHRDEDGQSALHLAADKGATDALKALMELGGDGNAADGEGITALHAAVIAENIEACRVLLEHGANPDQTDVDGDTPRKCAQEYGSEDLIKLLGFY